MLERNRLVFSDALELQGAIMRRLRCSICPSRVHQCRHEDEFREAEQGPSWIAMSGSLEKVVSGSKVRDCLRSRSRKTLRMPLVWPRMYQHVPCHSKTLSPLVGQLRRDKGRNEGLPVEMHQMPRRRGDGGGQGADEHEKQRGRDSGEPGDSFPRYRHTA